MGLDSPVVGSGRPDRVLAKTGNQKRKTFEVRML